MRWANHRSELKQIDAEIAAAKRRRDRALEELRAECERQRKTIQAECAAGRSRLRTEARDAERKGKRQKRRAWETYRIFSGSIRGQLEREYSAAEHDSLTEHNIEPEYLAFFRAHKNLFPRWRSPDDRAVHFAEYVEAHEGEIAAWYAAKAESAEAQADYEAAYLAHLEERGDLDDGELGPEDIETDCGPVETVEPPEDDPVLEPLHVTAQLCDVDDGGSRYHVVVAHPHGGALTFDARESKRGKWRATKRSGRAPAKVASAVRNWIESGALGDELSAAVPF